MSQEIELKLSLSEKQAAQLAASDFWYQYAGGAPDSFKLGNIYFDTPDRQLNKAHIALRIREKKEQFFQTLKTRGVSVNGLSHRGEWEWPIKQAALDYSLLEAANVQALEDVRLKTLEPLFSTDFQRTCWVIQWDEPSARIEAALDRGYVVAGNKKAPICELELELLDGDEKALRAVADTLSEMFDLEPIDKSKAERGFELLK